MSKRHQQGILTFRVYPESKRHYYEVFVWPSMTKMRDYLREYTKGWRTVIACVLWPSDAKYRHRRGRLGEIHFNIRHLGTDTLTHEATHAALEWARMLKLDVHNPVDPIAANKDEERLCEAIGMITHQIESVLIDQSFIEKK